MNTPRQAFILAAGFGSRMQPLTNLLPKPLLPLWNLPMLERIIRMLADWGVRDMFINTHFHSDQISASVHALHLPDCRLHVVHEPDILGTGGGLRNVSALLKSEPFWMVNADIAAELSPVPLLERFSRGDTPAVLWVTGQSGPRTVRLEADGCVADFAHPHPGTPGTVTFCGLQLLSPEILSRLPDTAFSSIIDAYRQVIRSGGSIATVEPPNTFWADLGTPEQYMNAHRDIQSAFRHQQPGRSLYDPANELRCESATQRGIRLTGMNAIGTAITIAPGARIHNCIIWDGSHIYAHASLQNCLVYRDTPVYASAASSDSLILPESLLSNAQHDLLRTHFGAEPLTVDALPARGSNRSFLRIKSPAKSAIFIQQDPHKRLENHRYARLTEWLYAHQVPVPLLFGHWPNQHALLLEDVGTVNLTDVIHQQAPKIPYTPYNQVLSALIHLQEQVTPAAISDHLPLEPPFSRDLYTWEHTLFLEQFLLPRISLSPAEKSGLQQDFSHLADQLLLQPPVLVHRDLQSSNIHLTNNGIRLIDYQGIRFGAAAYDLASLLCDPYAALPLETQTLLLQTYNQQSTMPISAPLFWTATIQRLLQALGAFGRLSQRAGTQRFSAYIPPALLLLRRASDHLPHLKNLAALILSLDPARN